MRTITPGLLLSVIALAEILAPTNSLKARWPGLRWPSFLPKPGTIAKQLVENPFKTEKGCRGLLDIVVLMDNSGSISRRQFSTVQGVVQQLVQSLPLSHEQAHMSLLVFASQVSATWTFTDPEATNSAAATAKVASLRQLGGRTNTAGALSHAYKLFFEDGGGARQNVPKLAVILTDGESDDPKRTRSAAKRLRDDGVIVAVVGVGDNINKKECRTMVGCKPTDTSCVLFLKTAWAALASSLFSLLKIVCTRLPVDATCGPWTPWSPCSATCGEGMQSSYREELSPATVGVAPCPTCAAPQGRSCKENGGVLKTQSCFAGDCGEAAGSPGGVTSGDDGAQSGGSGEDVPPPSDADSSSPNKEHTDERSNSEEGGTGAAGGREETSVGGGGEGTRVAGGGEGTSVAGGGEGTSVAGGGEGTSVAGGGEGTSVAGGGEGTSVAGEGEGTSVAGGGEGTSVAGGGEGTSVAGGGEDAPAKHGSPSGSGVEVEEEEGGHRGSGTGEQGGEGEDSSHPAGGNHHDQQQGNPEDDEQSKGGKSESGGVPAAAIAGGVLGALFLAGAGAGAGYYYYKGGGSAGKAQPGVQYEDVADTKNVVDEEKEAMISIGEESNMWADR